MLKKITVTAEHIAKGYPGKSETCPVALAMRDAGIPSPSVGISTFNWGFRAEDWTVLPSNVSIFIRNFDDHREVSPFEFEVEISLNA